MQNYAISQSSAINYHVSATEDFIA